MKALTLHAPWATLCVTRQPCDCSDRGWPNDMAFVNLGGNAHATDCTCLSFVKRFETRSKPCPPSIRGQRIAIHQAAKPPSRGVVGEWEVFEGFDGRWLMRPVEYRYDDSRTVYLPLGAVVGTAVIARSLPIERCSDDRAHVCVTVLGDLLLHEPLIGWERVSGGDSEHDVSDQLPYGDWQPGRHAYELVDVEVFDEPIPAKGKQGWWTWERQT